MNPADPKSDRADPAEELNADQLLNLVYAELRRLASSYLRAERPGHTLQTTALVHEAYLRMRRQDAGWNDAAHVLGVAARQMRRVLVDHARARHRLKRSGELLVVSEAGRPGVDVLALDAALDELAALDARQAEIVELRYFGGLNVDEAAAILAISPATLHREWAMARAWLRSRLEPGGAHDT